MELEFWGKILGIRVWGTNYLEIELIHKLPGIRECASKRVEPTVTVTITLTVTNTVSHGYGYGHSSYSYYCGYG